MKFSFATKPKQEPDANEKNAPKSAGNTPKDDSSKDKSSNPNEEDISEELNFMRKKHFGHDWHF